jgi:hypothetical protein
MTHARKEVARHYEANSLRASTSLVFGKLIRQESKKEYLRASDELVGH